MRYSQPHSITVSIFHKQGNFKRMLTEYMEQQSGWFTVVYLPKRSPFLNPVESKINRNLKKDICANYCYETEDNLLCSVLRYLRRTGCWPKI
jgi:hypothetical protein